MHCTYLDRQCTIWIVLDKQKANILCTVNDNKKQKNGIKMKGLYLDTSRLSMWSSDGDLKVTLLGLSIITI